MKRLLVTGATGFIGRHVLSQLDPEAWEIVAPCRHPAKQQNAPNLIWIEGDLLDPAQRSAIFSRTKATHWLHLAWFTEHGKFWASGDNLAWTAATLQMLEYFRAAGGEQVVMAGTCAEYDWNYGFCSEDSTPLLSSSLYGTAKDSLRRVAEVYCRNAGLKFAWGRIFSPYGPAEDSRRFIPSVICNMLASQAVPCSHGKQFRDFLHVTDVAEGFITLLESEALGNFNISSATPVQLGEIVSQLAKIIGWTGQAEFGAVAVPDNDPPLLIGDNRRLSALGWTPKMTLKNGLTDTIAWWEKHKLN